jgi:flagellar hook-length control protein FliK
MAEAAAAARPRESTPATGRPGASRAEPTIPEAASRPGAAQPPAVSVGADAASRPAEPPPAAVPSVPADPAPGGAVPTSLAAAAPAEGAHRGAPLPAESAAPGNPAGTAARPGVPAVPPQVAAAAGDALAMRIARALQDGNRTVTVALHPDELGRVEVRMAFRDGTVGVQMTLDRPATYDAFIRDRATLEQQMAQAGIDLGAGGLDLRFGGRQNAQPDGQAPGSGTASGQDAPKAEAASAGTARRPAGPGDSLVDILA